MWTISVAGVVVDGLSVTIPDAHVAQCALDRDAILLTRDGVFGKIAKHVPLRLPRG